MDHFRSEFRRIREGIAEAFRDHVPEAGHRHAARRPPRGHVVSDRLRIRDVMEGNLATVRPESGMRPALKLMIANRISSVPVVDASGRIVGALNEKDLMKVFYDPDAERVSDVMTRHPVTVSIDAPLLEVVDRLMSSDFRRVLIHEGGRLVGVITRSHLMPALLDALEERALARSRVADFH